MNLWRIRDTAIRLDHPILMGVLNVTPDSFSDGGADSDAEAAVERAMRLVESGAEIIDVGGESTRPGAEPVPATEEITRVATVIQRLSTARIVVSIDTMKPEVAKEAIGAGARIINDVTGFTDPTMRAVAAETGAGIVIMHMQGTPATMQDDPSYSDVVAEVVGFLGQRADECMAAGVDRSSICVDPGIGFGKTIAHNLALLDELDALVSLGYPVMVGASRKGFLGRILDIPEANRRDLATAVTTALGVERGAMVFRVHEPGVSREAARLAWAMVESRALRHQPGNK